ncbi:hypothetical protein SS50377_22103 [Spironucleus salmonicida]|uniref:Uncharacterized protein n=1 Tax=Spironucleus salmonicida TaxID=348837 RepID=V6LM64_9EUKA|nr:hypothetical protein SS50377_22103 [Spironucleus salmonicida]|eukprot:EST45735.1 Hypothetical protein SS50377_14307 [Spironucleus salmonicida]
MQLISSQEAFSPSLRPIINYSVKQPQLIIKNISNNIEIFEVAYFKQIFTIKPPQSVYLIQTFKNLIFLASYSSLFVYQNFTLIADIPLNFCPYQMILEIHEEVSEKVEIIENEESEENDTFIKVKQIQKQNIFIFSNTMQINQIQLTLDENLGNFMLQQEDYKIIDLTEKELDIEFDNVMSIKMNNQYHIITYGNSFIIYDCFSREIYQTYTYNDTEFIQQDIEEFSPKNSCLILLLTKSVVQSSIYAVQFSNFTHFLNLSSTSNKLTILKANFEVENPKSIVLMKNQFIIFYDDFYQEFDLKSKIMINKFTFSKRHLTDKLLQGIVLVSPKGLENELNVLAIFTNQIQVYSSNKLKLDRVLPGYVTQLLFVDSNTTKNYDRDLRYININLQSKRIFTFTNDLKNPLSMHKIEDQKFSIDSIRNFQFYNKFLFGVLVSSNDEYVFQHDFSSGKFTRYSLPGGRHIFTEILNKSSKSITEKHDGITRQNILENELASNERLQKFQVDLQIPDKISSFSVKYNLLCLCGNNQIAVKYFNNNEIFSTKLDYSPEFCQFFTQSEKLKINIAEDQYEMIQDIPEKIYERGILCFDKSKFTIFDALNGTLIIESEFRGFIKETIEEGEEYYVDGDRLIVFSYQKLSIITYEISPNRIIFRVQRTEQLPENCPITIRQVKISLNNVYFCSGRKLIYFDIVTAAFYQIYEFDHNIISFDMSQGFYIIGFEQIQGVFFYIEDCNSPAKRFGEEIQLSRQTFTQKANGRKMLEYLQGNVNTQIKMTKKSKAFQPVQGEAVDFLREEDVLFIEGEEALKIVKNSDTESVLGVTYLFGKFKPEVYQDDKLREALLERKQELRNVINENCSSHELMQSIIDIL